MVHDVIGGGTSVSLLWTRGRSGVLSLFYLDRATAYEAFDMLSQRMTFSFLEDYLTAGSPLDMLFAVTGDVSINLDPTTRKRWIVDVGFQELSS